MSFPSGKLSLAALTVTAGLTATGCGGSTRSPFVAKADQICKPSAVARTEVNAKVAKSNGKSLEVVGREAPRIAALELAAIAQLQPLQPPSALTSDWHQLLTGMQELAQDNNKLAAAAKANNTTTAQKIDGEGRRLRARLTVIAKRDGFTYCGRKS